MAFTKIARGDILDVRYSNKQLPDFDFDLGFEKLAKPMELSDDGYLYVKVRAISSRVNKNNDGWPSEELAKGYKTFEGRPIFVDHNNGDPSRARGVVVWSKLHVDDDKTSALDQYYSTAPDNHKPPTWIELMLEVDAKSFPRLAGAIIGGDIDSVSMGANIDRSICSVCDNEAVNPQQYCSHVKNKGLEFEIVSSDGSKTKKRSYEDCYGVNFFEISFVFDPADETALISNLSPAMAKVAGPLHHDLDREVNSDQFDEENKLHEPHSEKMRAPQDVNTLRADQVCPQCGSPLKELQEGIHSCPECGFNPPPEGFDNPDLSEAHENDLQQDQAVENAQVPFDDPMNKPGQTPVAPVRPIGTHKSKASEGLISDMNFTVKVRTTKVADNSNKIEFLVGLVHAAGHSFNDNELELQKAAANAGITVSRWDAAEALERVSEFNFEKKDEECTCEDPENCTCNSNKKEATPAHYPYPEGTVEGLEPLEAPEEVQNEEAQGATEEDWGTKQKVHQFSPLPPARAPKSLTSAEKKVVTKGQTKATVEPTDQKIVSDQLAPVESGVEMNKNADRETIKREETDANGLKRTEEIMREFTPGAPENEEVVDETVPAETAEVETDVVSENADWPYAHQPSDSQREPIAAKVSPEQKLMAALKLAKFASAMGVISSDDELNFVAEIETETMEQITARLEMLKTVKDAGLARAKSRPALASRFPSLRIASNLKSEDDIDNLPDEALFM